MGYLAVLSPKAAGDWLHVLARMPQLGAGWESGIPRVLPLSGTWAKGSGARTVCKASISHQPPS